MLTHPAPLHPLGLGQRRGLCASQLTGWCASPVKPVPYTHPRVRSPRALARPPGHAACAQCSSGFRAQGRACGKP